MAEARAVETLVPVSGGTLVFSWIAGNEVLENGSNGIFIDFGNHNISVFDNRAVDNQVFDCNDASTGFGTLGTANGWFNNTGYLSSPRGLCRPGRWR